MSCGERMRRGRKRKIQAFVSEKEYEFLEMLIKEGYATNISDATRIAIQEAMRLWKEGRWNDEEEDN